MPWLDPRTCLAVFVASAGASLFVAGCSASCNCPAGGVGIAYVAVPDAGASPITAVSTSAPCTALPSGENVQVSTDRAGTCQVLVQLQNGDTYAFSVQFEDMVIHGACDCGVIRTVGTPNPTRTDAGLVDATIFDAGTD